MLDGDHVRFLFRFLSDSLPVPQSEDRQGKEVIKQPLGSRHCATYFILNHYQKTCEVCVTIFFLDEENGAWKVSACLRLHSQT